MKRILLAALISLAGMGSAQSQTDSIRTHTLHIWNNRTAPHSNGLDGNEQVIDDDRVGHTTEATLHIFFPTPATDRKIGIVICPGGGYSYLSFKNEGTAMARWLATQGITAAVLKYRLPNGQPEVPLEDAVQALRTMGGLEAGATGITIDRVGIMGFSAGGHLAAMASTLGTTWPAFAILFYPVITATPGQGHQGSFNALLGKQRNAETDAAYSLHTRVTDQTPPTLLLLCDDDEAVPPVNSLLYYQALKSHGVKAALTIFPQGGHGWGFRNRFPYKAEWQRAITQWLRFLYPSR